MADTKISALPAVAAPADGDEFATNQAGVTKKETRAQIVSTITGNFNAHVAVTTAPIHGSTVASAADKLVHRDGTGRAFVLDVLTGAGAAADPSHSFTGDPDTGVYNYGANELGVATGGAHRAHWNTTGALIIGPAVAASSLMTGPGLTIQQGAFGDEAAALQSTNVAHGMTAEADTDTYGQLLKSDAAAGGLYVKGLKDSAGTAGGALVLGGFLGEDADTAKTVNGRAIVEVYGHIRDAGTPTQIGDTNADGNVFAVRTRRGGALVTLLLVDEDADLHVLNDVVVAGLVDGVDIANHQAAAVLDHPNDSVTDAKLRNSAATSVIGRAGAGVGDPADIVAGADNQVLARTAGTLAFQAVVPAMVTDRTRNFLVMPDNPVVGCGEMGVPLADATQTSAMGQWCVPSDFVNNMSVQGVVLVPLTGTATIRMSIKYEAVGQDFATHTDDTGWINQALVQGAAGPALRVALTQALSAEAAGDFLHFWFSRDGAAGGDVMTDFLYFVGWYVTYMADS